MIPNADIIMVGNELNENDGNDYGRNDFSHSHFVSASQSFDTMMKRRRRKKKTKEKIISLS